MNTRWGVARGALGLGRGSAHSWERWLQERGQGEKATAKVFLWMGVLTLPLLAFGIGFLLAAGVYTSFAGQAEVELYREIENALPALLKACQDLADSNSESNASGGVHG